MTDNKDRQRRTNKKPHKEPTRWDTNKVDELNKRLIASTQEASTQEASVQKPYFDEAYKKQRVKAVVKIFHKLKEHLHFPVMAMIQAINTKDVKLLREIENCKIGKTLICMLTIDDVAKLSPVINCEILLSTASNQTILRTIQGKAEKPLEVNKIRYLAFLLERLMRWGLIGDNYQDFYITKGTFVCNGKPIRTYRQALERINEDFETLKNDPQKDKWNDRKRKRFEMLIKIETIVSEIRKSGR